MKIVEILSLVVLDCTFTMYWPRVYSISQWWNLYEKERASPPGQFIALQAINALKGTISGSVGYLDGTPYWNSVNLESCQALPHDMILIVNLVNYPVKNQSYMYSWLMFHCEVIWGWLRYVVIHIKRNSGSNQAVENLDKLITSFYR